MSDDLTTVKVHLTPLAWESVSTITRIDKAPGLDEVAKTDAINRALVGYADLLPDLLAGRVLIQQPDGSVRQVVLR